MSSHRHQSLPGLHKVPKLRLLNPFPVSRPGNGVGAGAVAVTYTDVLCHTAPTRGCTGGGMRGVKLSELAGSHLGCAYSRNGRGRLPLSTGRDLRRTAHSSHSSSYALACCCHCRLHRRWGEGCEAFCAHGKPPAAHVTPQSVFAIREGRREKGTYL